jgi:hypothetical protein
LESKGDNMNYYGSIGATYNYSIFKDLYIGAGIEPTAYRTDGKWKFDVPPTVKIGYNLKFAEVALSAKAGLFNVLESSKLSSGHLNDLQLQLFIPF